MENVINQQPTDEEVELETADNQYWNDLYNSLKALEDNEDFIRVVKEGYLKEHAVRTTSLLATEYARQAGIRNTLFETLVGVSSFEQYLSTIYNMRSIEE
jgi:hypothetical protein